MASMEVIVVVAIVGVAALLAARSLYRTIAGKQRGCAMCGDQCPSAEGCDPSAGVSDCGAQEGAMGRAEESAEIVGTGSSAANVRLTAHGSDVRRG